MTWLDRLERRLHPYAVPHVTLGLILCQVYVLFRAHAKPEFVGALHAAARRR